ncbi:uncharacterized protein LOC142604889 [Balearica regulorum gibbericeps]|uniref:uncharacterized protein LOC142604889 n=1 Tax=Balearica regulorum gibbericeps TaxID=100784 RepID=UPI003F635279
MCIHIHFGGPSETVTSSAKPAGRNPPAWAPVQAQEVRSSVLQPQLPCKQSRASAVQSEQACHAGTLAKPGPAQVLRHEVSSPDRTPSLAVDREGHRVPFQCRRGLNYLMLNIKQRCFPFAGLLTVHFRAGKIGRWRLSKEQVLGSRHRRTPRGHVPRGCGNGNGPGGTSRAWAVHPASHVHPFAAGVSA